MNNIPMSVRQRLLFSDELIRIREMSEYQIADLKQAAQEGDGAFSLALGRICGNQAMEDVGRIARICAERAQWALDQISAMESDGHSGEVKEKFIWQIMDCYAVGNQAVKLTRLCDGMQAEIVEEYLNKTQTCFEKTLKWGNSGYSEQKKFLQ